MNDKEMILKDAIQDEEKYSKILSFMFDDVADLIEQGKTERQAFAIVLMEFLYNNDFEVTKDGWKSIMNELLEEWSKKDE